MSKPVSTSAKLIFKSLLHNLPLDEAKKMFDDRWGWYERRNKDREEEWNKLVEEMMQLKMQGEKSLEVVDLLLKDSLDNTGFSYRSKMTAYNCTYAA